MISTTGRPIWAFQRTHYWIPKIQDGGDPNRHVDENASDSMNFGTQPHIRNWMTIT